MSKNASEINHSILKYICKCQASGDFMTLRELGIPSEIQDEIKTMTITEIQHIAQISVSFIKSIEIDSTILCNQIKRVKSEGKTQYLLGQLIQRGAPLQLVKKLVGITAMEFSNLRKMQNIEFRGRTQLPTMDEEKSIFNTCEKLGINACEPDSITGEQWIELSRQTDLTIRLIYKVICEGEEPTHAQIN